MSASQFSENPVDSGTCGDIWKCGVSRSKSICESLTMKVRMVTNKKLRRKSMRAETKVKQVMAVILTAICLFAGVKLPVRAATTAEECYGLVVQLDSEGEILDASTAIVLQMDGELGVFSNVMDDDVEGSVVVLSTGTENAYLLQFEDVVSFGSYELSLWGLDPSDEDYANAFSDSSFLEVADPHQNDIAIVVYLSSESEEVEAIAITLLECDENGFLTVDQYPVDAYYPAALVNDEGKLIGICLEDNQIWAVRSGAEFYKDFGQDSQSEEKAPPLPDREDRQPSETQETKEDMEPASVPPSEPASVPPSEPASVPSTDTVAPIFSNDPVENSTFPIAAVVVVFIIMAVVIAAVVVVLVLLSNKKKKQGSAASQIQTFNPGPVAAPVPNVVPTPHTVPIQYPQANEFPSVQAVPDKAQTLWLAAKGGCMNGRVYPMEKKEVSIGRDVASTIRYPADTAGISRVHAKLYWQEGRLMLMDCNSTSGTFLQRQGKLTPMVPVEVRSGDVFYVGEKINSFEIRD